MEAAVSPLPDDVKALKALVGSMGAELAAARAKASATEALIGHLKLQIAKLRREQYGPSAERSRRLLDQLELQLEELEATASEDDLAADAAATRTTIVTAFERERPVKKPFPEHLPRERIVIPAPCSCPTCGGTRLSKLGEDVTETLEVIPLQWKVIQTVREKFSCRNRETITQPPAPFHVVPRGWAGLGLLAMLLFDKYGQHQPLNRQAERFACEGVPLSLSTLADQVGAATFALMPLYRRIGAHVLAADRLHGDNGAGPRQGQDRCWQAVGLCPRRQAIRRRRSALRAVPPFARPPWRTSASGSRQLVRDPAGRRLWRLCELYAADRRPGPVLEAGFFAHARRKFFELADVEGSARKKSRGERTGAIYPIALEAVQRQDALFDIEREDQRIER